MKDSILCHSSADSTCMLSYRGRFLKLQVIFAAQLGDYGQTSVATWFCISHTELKVITQCSHMMYARAGKWLYAHFTLVSIVTHRQWNQGGGGSSGGSWEGDWGRKQEVLKVDTWVSTLCHSSADSTCILSFSLASGSYLKLRYLWCPIWRLWDRRLPCFCISHTKVRTQCSI